MRIAAPMRRLEIEAERMGLYLEVRISQQQILSRLLTLLQQKPVIVHEPLLTEEIVRELREKGKQEVEGIPSEVNTQSCHEKEWLLTRR